MRKINYYNIYKDGELLMSDVTCQVASKICKVPPEMVSTYANQGNDFERDGSIFRLEIGSSTYITPKVKPNVRVRKYDLAMPEEFIKDWNNMKAAADLIRSGKGKIVVKKANGKFVRYVEAVR